MPAGVIGTAKGSWDSGYHGHMIVFVPDDQERYRAFLHSCQGRVAPDIGYNVHSDCIRLFKEFTPFEQRIADYCREELNGQI